MLFFFQFVVVVYDEYYPNDRGTATATFSVNRNPTSPRFVEGTSYTVTIDEKHPYGSLVLKLNATDSDGVSIDFLSHYPSFTTIVFCSLVCLCSLEAYIANNINPNLSQSGFTVFWCAFTL